ncbi:3-deoxy-D-manno-octulosonic acid transferase [Thermodesulfovibrionales bacterium]|nr:3-deoxy-D-manno-octulosonic acid transferase [Thermodesulfovibrionales bacterium]
MINAVYNLYIAMYYSIYSIIYFIATSALAPFEYLKRSGALRRRWVKERFGIYPSSRTTHQSDARIWIHAVSVGEVITAVPLIQKIRDRYPSAEIIISTVTDTGQKVAKERVNNSATVIYIPFDLPFAIKNAFSHFKPAIFIVMETELWPNIIRIFGSQAPVLLMNGRISVKSFKGYKRLRFFIKGVLKDISLLCMQNELYADRIKTLGAEPGKVKVIGNFKFDTSPSISVPEWTKILSGPIIVAGSTHKTEEDLIINAYKVLRATFPEANLIIAPRHPERFREVEGLIKGSGLKYIKRSWSSEGEGQHAGVKKSGIIVILDTVGELASVYGACSVAIVGGSFIKHGGQNPLEPAYWGKAIICGPHMDNFPFIDDFYRVGGAIRTDPHHLYRSLVELIGSPEKMSSMGKAARGLYEKNAGATERAMEIIDGYLR